MCCWWSLELGKSEIFNGSMVCEQGLALGICTLGRKSWKGSSGSVDSGTGNVTSFGVCYFWSCLVFVFWVLRDSFESCFCLLSVEKFILFHKGISHGFMSNVAHTGTGHLQHLQVPGAAAGLCRGEQWDRWGRIPCPLSALPFCSSLSQTSQPHCHSTI